MLYYLLDASAVVCALACLRLLHSWRKRNSSLPFPPGPKGLPLIGNVLDMAHEEEWETARKWGEKYGPLVYVENFGTSYIFVNSYQTAVDLFERRGSNYSSRPKNVMMDLEGWEWVVSLMPYGDELRRSRQLLFRFLRPAVLGDYCELQTQSTHRLLERLLKSPDKYPELLQHSIGSTTLMVSYGYKASENDDPYIALAEKGVEAVGDAERFFLVNAIPLLQYLPAWFPGAGFKKIAEKGYKLSMEMRQKPFEMAKTKNSEGTAAPSMTSKLLEDKMAGDTLITDDALIAKVTGVVYAGGADTSISSLHSFFLAMLLYPDVQQCAQDELDRVVGKDILPSFADRPSLPYIEAIIKETLRWQPVTPLAVAHTAAEDGEYNGYFIPAGAIILPNVWAMQRDPAEYPEPDEFIPERWLPTDGKEPPLDVHKTAFGFGRRICPGRHFLDNTAFIIVASILAAFNIRKALDENGVPITPKVEYTPQFVRHPKPFKYMLTPRSDKIGAVIRQAAESSK